MINGSIAQKFLTKQKVAHYQRKLAQLKLDVQKCEQDIIELQREYWESEKGGRLNVLVDAQIPKRKENVLHTICPTCESEIRVDVSEYSNSQSLVGSVHCNVCSEYVLFVTKYMLTLIPEIKGDEGDENIPDE